MLGRYGNKPLYKSALQKNKSTAGAVDLLGEHQLNLERDSHHGILN